MTHLAMLNKKTNQNTKYYIIFSTAKNQLIPPNQKGYRKTYKLKLVSLIFLKLTYTIIHFELVELNTVFLFRSSVIWNIISCNTTKSHTHTNACKHMILNSFCKFIFWN
jgi:hypothetical protein